MTQTNKIKNRKSILSPLSYLVRWLKKWCFYEYIEEYGWKGFFCEQFSIKSTLHPFYVDGFELGKTMDKERLDNLIQHLYLSPPTFNPARTRGYCQVKGLIAIGKKRFGSGFCEILDT